MNILITGAAGFIGFHLAKSLLEEGVTVYGIDSLNDYYNPQLKLDRLALLKPFNNFSFAQLDIVSAECLRTLFKQSNFSHVVHLAGQAGVRYSLESPQSYVQSNLLGFANVLECVRLYPVEHFIYASSSSVYGLNSKLPFSVADPVDHPASLYAATKKSNELMAHSYSHLYGIPSTGLRFFTVYGPWGRPDMATYIFTQAILEGRPLPVFNEGKLSRDFTYIDDIVDGVRRLLSSPPRPLFDATLATNSLSKAPYSIYNIGNSSPVVLMDFITLLESLLSKKANISFLPMQKGDVLSTYANIDDLTAYIGFKPVTSLAEGLSQYVAWHKEYYTHKG